MRAWRYVAVALALVMANGLIGCGDDDTADAGTDPDDYAESPPVEMYEIVTESGYDDVLVICVGGDEMRSPAPIVLTETDSKATSGVAIGVDYGVQLCGGPGARR